MHCSLVSCSKLRHCLSIKEFQRFLWLRAKQHALHVILLTARYHCFREALKCKP